MINIVAFMFLENTFVSNDSRIGFLFIALVYLLQKLDIFTEIGKVSYFSLINFVVVTITLIVNSNFIQEKIELHNTGYLLFLICSYVMFFLLDYYRYKEEKNYNYKFEMGTKKGKDAL